MPPFKDEHVLIIAPGSQTTETQLGLPESFTPPRWRFPSRMFPGLKEGEWEPIKIQSVTRTIHKPVTENAISNGVHSKVESNGTDTKVEEPPVSEAVPVDIEMTDTTVPSAEATVEEPKPDIEMVPSDPPPEETTTEESWEDDPFSNEGAVYPIQAGRIENWSCFFALLTHIYNMISPPFHMPVMVVAQPCWSARDHEMITQYFFENWKIPAFCLIDAALTAAYAYGVPTALVVDVGHDKCDITAVTDFMVNDSGRGVAIAGCGGRDMTKRLQQVLEKRGFDEAMAEKLKKSSLCEILPVGTALPVDKVINGEISNPAAAASTGATDSGLNAKEIDGQRPGQMPRGPGPGTEVGEEGGNDDDDNEGILDVAAIVARDNAAELLAKREQEKAARMAARKGGAAEPPKAVRLRNSEKEKATFTYDEYLPLNGSSDEAAVPQNRKRTREIEVGVERFMAATPMEGMTDGILDTITAAMHSTILGVPDIPSRSTLWENLIILGNGTRIRGFTPALLSILASRYTLSPSNATIFTSELPSNFSTPVATPGTNTPIPGQPGHPMHHPAGHGVNPLLVAATRNVMQPNQHLQVPGAPQMDPAHHSHRGFSQSPTSIKTVKTPEYFPEWKDPSVAGMEEAAFLGAQVAAKVIFIVDQGISKGFLTRLEYNDLGPAGIHDCAM